MSASGFLLQWFRINRGTILDCSLVNSTPISLYRAYEGGGPMGLARRGAPVSTSTAVLWADLFCWAGWVTLLLRFCRLDLLVKWNSFDDRDSSRGDRRRYFWLMDLLLRSALPLSVNSNCYATKLRHTWSFWCGTGFYCESGSVRQKINTNPTLRVDLNPRISKICASWMSVWNISANCFGTIKIQPELKYLKTILEVFTSWFQRVKAWEHEFGRVPSISFISTGSKMAWICKGIYYKYFEGLQCQISSIDRGPLCVH